MTIIAVTNNKGGVGKTETTLCLGRGLAHLGYQVTLVDLDGQPGNLTHRCGVTPDRTVADLFSGLSIGAAGVDVGDVTLIPSDERTDELADDLVLKPLGVMRLANILAPLAGVILIDCPPNVGSLTFSALVAADWVITPTTPESSSLVGVSRIHEKVAEVRAHLGRAPRRLGAVAVKVRETIEHQQGMESLRKLERRILGVVPMRGGVDAQREIPRYYIPIAKAISEILDSDE